MEAVVGKNPLNRAYFDGRSDILKKHIDSQMGDGAFEKLTQALEKRDYKTAEKIIKKSR
ncbi:MAG: hypothetical protein U9P10_13770 [Thermodesulfobacteriota bacterium]|nr:hypothetical protein [Thermodesulfobacteriota bacterium]